jgi:hypothetical protein
MTDYNHAGSREIAVVLREESQKNEPVVSQVVGGDGGCNGSEVSQEVAPVDSFEFSAEEIAAAVKLARQRTEELLREG